MLGTINRHPLFSSKLKKKKQQKQNKKLGESCFQDVEPHPPTYNHLPLTPIPYDIWISG